jgi:signal transduction histidine kinase
MTRRIALALLGLVVGIVTLLAVPLGIRSDSRENAVFRSQQVARAQSLADIAEQQLVSAVRPVLDLNRYLLPGEAVSVLTVTGQVLTGRQPASSSQKALVRRAGLGQPGTVRHDHTMTAAVRIGDASEHDGVLVLQRSTGPLDQRIRGLWELLSAIAVGAVLAAAAVSWRIARWVSRPLRQLDVAASTLGDGHLATRAGEVSGPPEIRELAQSFNRMASRLETLVHSQRSMLADVSHQLRTPLTALRLRLELMAGDNPDPAELDGALGELSRLSRLVDGLLTVSRAESATTVRQPVDIAGTLHARAEAWQPVAIDCGVTLDVSVRGRPFALSAPGHIEQILDNVIDNALEAAPSGGHVRVSASTAHGRVHVVVADDGPGMPAGKYADAVRRFNSGRADAGGSGLGLAIVDRLVTADGGQLTLSETPGGGLTVAVALSCVPAEALAASGQSTPGASLDAAELS